MLPRLILLSVLLFSAVASAESVPINPPNVVLIMADDLSSDYLSAYSRDGAPTPNIERMAREGIRFVNYISPSICAPARVAVITSRSPKYTNVYHNFLDSPRYPQDVNRFLTIGRMFRDAGYATCFTGKWNIAGSLAHYDTVRAWEPLLRKNCGLEDPVTASRYWHPGIVDENFAQVPTRPTDFGPDLFSAHGLDFIIQQLAAQKPFFYHAALVEPHGVRGDDSPNVPGTTGATQKQRYRHLISYMDQKVGAVLDAVQGTNTIVIFLADNPTASEGKSWATPKGMIVPCLVWGAGIVPRGRSTELLSAHDIMPTLAEAIGAPPFVTDGRSHYDYFTGKTPVTSRKKISYIGASQILVTQRKFFVRDAVRGNPDGKLTHGRGQKDISSRATSHRYGRVLTSWCGPMLKPGKGILRGSNFAKRWSHVERREQW